MFYKFLKREGVIIMKKTKMINKKGFTLSELLMVIAIIVILSGATMIGVVSTINKTRENAAKLEENNGDNFESEAMVAVESAKGTAPSHVVNQEKVDTPTPAETTKAPAETTKAPAETTKAPAETTKAPAETTKAPAETTKAPVETTKAQGSTPSNASGSSFKYNETWSGNQKVTVDFSIGQVKSFTICVPGQNNLDINAYGNTKNVENLGNGVYKITPKWNVNNFAFTMSGLTAEGQPPMYIVSYEKA